MYWNGKAIYHDPYGASKAFEGTPAPDLVLITDIHGDHFHLETLQSIYLAKATLVRLSQMYDGNRCIVRLRSLHRIIITVNLYSKNLEIMSIKRKATAVWGGSGKEGKGHLSTQSTVLHKTQYSFSSRFESGIGTNPEELIAAAHSGCFTMKLSFVLGEAGFTPEELKTDCIITLDSGTVTQSQLFLEARVPGISREKFDECVKNAEVNCPISKLLKSAISVEARLI